MFGGAPLWMTLSHWKARIFWSAFVPINLGHFTEFMVLMGSSPLASCPGSEERLLLTSGDLVKLTSKLQELLLASCNDNSPVLGDPKILNYLNPGEVNQVPSAEEHPHGDQCLCASGAWPGLTCETQVLIVKACWNKMRCSQQPSPPKLQHDCKG